MSFLPKQHTVKTGWTCPQCTRTFPSGGVWWWVNDWYCTRCLWVWFLPMLVPYLCLRVWWKLEPFRYGRATVEKRLFAFVWRRWLVDHAGHRETVIRVTGWRSALVEDWCAQRKRITFHVWGLE